MTKEMVVSSSNHDTKIAILEDGQVVEVYFEREKQYSLAGSIYKGRVTRILPGMQSAFVNIGLERDAFLYVSDFLEQVEEYDRVATTGDGKSDEGRSGEGREGREQRNVATSVPGASEEATDAEPTVGTAAEGLAEVNGPEAAEQSVAPRQASPAGTVEEEEGNRGRRFRRGRRHRGRHRGIPDSKFARHTNQPPASPQESPQASEETPAPAALAQPGAESSEQKPEQRLEPAGENRTEARPDQRSEGRRGRFDRRRGRRPDHRPDRRPEHRSENRPERRPESQSGDNPESWQAPVLLPGESIAKYRGAAVPSAPQASESALSEASSAEDAVASMMQAPPQESLEAPFVEPATLDSPEEILPELMHAEEYQPEATYGVRLEGIAPLETPRVESELESEAKEDRFLTAEEAVEAVREERMIEDLEDEAAEFADSEEGPSWGSLVESVEAHGTEADAENPEGHVDETGEAGGAELEAHADSDTAAEPAAAEGEAAPQQASVRERPANPRFQRRGRWQARRQRGGERGGERGGDRGETGQRRPQRSFPREAAKPLIGDLLKERQEIIVQVAKEPLGKKGARITSHIALPGRYIVYMPTLDHVGVSRKIASDEERHRLKRIIVEHTRNLSGGFIVRTAGEGATDEDLRQDVQFLVNLWADIKAKAEKATAPALLHHDLDLTLRTLRDQLSDEFQTIWVDNEQVYEQIVSLVQRFQPTLINRVRLYSKDVPLFEETGVQEEINKALRPKVWLKSGGYIVINQTEALVAIDVNTGKFVGKSNRLEDTIVKTNVEAIQEIVRQIRLRDLGGIIVIDFIDMDERRNRQKVMSTLEDAMRADKAPSKILSFNEFGLLAITRKRVRQSLERTLCQPCAYCSGAGLVKTPATVSLEILTEAKRNAAELTGKQITLRVNPEVGKALKARENDVLAALEEITGRGVIIRNDAAVHIENFYFD